MNKKINNIFFAVFMIFVFPARGETYREISLKESLDFAIENSFDVKLAKLDLLISETDKTYASSVYDTFLTGGASYGEDKRQQSSIFYPDNSQNNIYHAGVSKTLITGTNLNAEFFDNRAWSNSQFVSLNPAHTAEAAFTAVQPIGKNTFGFIDRNKLSVTKLAVENASLTERDRIEGYIADVSKAYWGVVYSKRSVEIYEEILEKARELYDSSLKNFDMGLIERGDLLAARANLESVKSEIIIAKNNLENTIEDFKMLINMPETLDIIPLEKLEEKVNGCPSDIGACLKTSFNKRRDYMSAKRDVEIKGIELKIKKNSALPEIDLKGTMAFNGARNAFSKSMNKVTGTDNSYYYGGIEVSLSLENSASKADFLRQKYEKEKTIIKLKQIERKIITETVNSFNSVRALKESARHVEEAVNLSEEKLIEEDKRFRSGRSNMKRVIDYQDDLLRAKLKKITVLFEYTSSLIDLERVMNNLLEKEGYESSAV
ncbi:outer membrane efflux protein [Candidatus Omnitrophus magneticus]|uniref:Outer membrane efflux protein n=1 Tax=Candidatus Omnitrophus magneticus TaxID=1609969 RepID=A0A0F0CR33_9BACT|nr:outer membrane efflux protein [Candidatus Omnitrophus magneticus]